jgi:hypothetical protein
MLEQHEAAAATWKSRHVVRAGGLFGLGFADDNDLLLVATHDGRGVVDCITGELVARDADPSFPFDEGSRTAQGIGPIAGRDVVIAGEVFGGTLPSSTSDGWSLIGKLSNSTTDVLRLTSPENPSNPVELTGFVPEVRVFGFSPTGRSFVIGTGAEVFTFAR